MLSSLLIAAALGTFGLWAFVRLHDVYSLFLLPIEAKGATYWHNVCSNLLRHLTEHPSSVAVPAVPPLLILLVNWGEGPVAWRNASAMAILLVLTLSQGIGVTVLTFLEGSYVFKGGLPRGCIFLFIDAFIVLVPPFFLAATLLGSDFRLTFFVSLPLAIIVSSVIRVYYRVTTFGII